MKTFNHYLKESLETIAAILIGYSLGAVIGYYWDAETNPEYSLVGWVLPAIATFLAIVPLRYLFESKIKSFFNL